MSAAEPARRPSSAELVHDVAVAALSRTGAPPEHSVTISRNAKGIAQFEVTVRGFAIADVLADARTAFESLSAEYPYPDANGGTE